jgi:hypothetical protein
VEVETVELKVIGGERVTVPAGTFDAFRSGSLGRRQVHRVGLETPRVSR